MKSDQRPQLAEVFRKLRDGQGPIWITWDGKRLLLGLPDENWLSQGVGPAVIATRRGYRKVQLIGRTADGGHGVSKKGTVKAQPFRTEDNYFAPITEKQIRAIILEEYER